MTVPKMIKRFVIVILIMVAALPLFSQKMSYNLSVEEVLRLPEDEIDLGISFLIMAKEAYPELNIEVFDHVLDFMAGRIHTLMQGVTDPLGRIAMMNTYLYMPGWWNDTLTFTYDLDDLEAVKTKNQFLNGYLASREGSCVTMPMLHIVLAERLGWPIQAVRSPKHIFCRYVDENLKKNNIEATCGGGYIPNHRYISDTDIPDEAIRNGVYLRTLSKKEYLASMLLNNARFHHVEKNDLKKSIYYTSLAISIDSTLSPAFWNMGKYYYCFAHDLETEMIEEIKELNAIHHALSFAQTRNPNNSNPIVSLQVPELVNNFQVKHDPHSYFRQGFVKNEPVVNKTKMIRQTASNTTRKLHEEYFIEVQSIRKKYVPYIKEALARSEALEKKAKEMGIVLKFPEEFFIKQSESIEKFKKTGVY